ncbi:unnamed protein product [Hapterophycus canaliculatus]
MAPFLLCFLRCARFLRAGGVALSILSRQIRRRPSCGNSGVITQAALSYVHAAVLGFSFRRLVASPSGVCVCDFVFFDTSGWRGDVPACFSPSWGFHSLSLLPTKRLKRRFVIK